MKTYAGNLYVELPGSWDDETQHVYRNESADIELRIHRSPVDRAATPTELLDTMVERLKLVGPLEKVQRSNTRIGEHEGAMLYLSCEREDDESASLMYVLIYKHSPSVATTVTAQAEQRSKDRLAAAWQEFLSNARIVEIR